MNIADLLKQLESEPERNQALSVLEQLLLDGRLVETLAKIISDPSSIENTNRFASLLAALPSDAYIPELIRIISDATPGQSHWLADYMYALIELLQGRDEMGPVEESFVHVLGSWLLSTRSVEISWKAGDILMQLGHPASRQYLLKGAVDPHLFCLTRIACIRGIVNHFRSDAGSILRELSDDPDEEVRKAVLDAQAWLTRKRNENVDSEA